MPLIEPIHSMEVDVSVCIVIAANSDYVIKWGFIMCLVNLSAFCGHGTTVFFQAQPVLR